MRKRRRRGHFKQVKTSSNKFKQVEIAFVEYKCASTEPIVPLAGFTCAQLSQRQTIYRDVYGNPVQVEVNLGEGCELRCSTAECRAK